MLLGDPLQYTRFDQDTENEVRVAIGDFGTTYIIGGNCGIAQKHCVGHRHLAQAERDFRVAG